MRRLIKRLMLSKLRWPWQKQIGWSEIDEDFVRYTLLKTRWGNLYLHRLSAPIPHAHCHDHPWWFVTLLLRGGYYEMRGVNSPWVWRRPGTILFRPATFRHSIITPGVSWSLVLTGPRSRPWGFVESCDA